MYDGYTVAPDIAPVVDKEQPISELTAMNNSLVRDIYVSTYFDVLHTSLDGGTNPETAVKLALKMAKLAAGGARVATATLYG